MKHTQTFDNFSEHPPSPMFNVEDMLMHQEISANTVGPLDQEITTLIDRVGSLFSPTPTYINIDRPKTLLEVGYLHQPNATHYAVLNSIHTEDGDPTTVVLPNDLMSQMYFAGIGLLGIVVLYKLMKQR